MLMFTGVSFGQLTNYRPNAAAQWPDDNAKPVKENTVQWIPAGENDLTQEEFNYLTKGLKVQEESGLDMKKGYVLQEVYSKKIGLYTFKGICRTILHKS